MKNVRSLTTKKRKPLFCTVLLFLLAALMLTSCASKDDYTIETDEAGNPSESQLAQIAEDFFNYFYADAPNPPEKNDHISVDRCYGIYDGSVPVMFSLISVSISEDVEIGGSKFHYSSGNRIYVWKNGDIFTLQEAYDQDLLTKEHLQTIAEIHNNWYQ